MDAVVSENKSFECQGQHKLRMERWMDRRTDGLTDGKPIFHLAKVVATKWGKGHQNLPMINLCRFG